MNFNKQEENEDGDNAVDTRQMSGDCWICPYTDFQDKEQACIKEMSNQDTTETHRDAQFPLTVADSCLRDSQLHLQHNDQTRKVQVEPSIECDIRKEQNNQKFSHEQEFGQGENQVVFQQPHCFQSGQGQNIQYCEGGIASQPGITYQESYHNRYEAHQYQYPYNLMSGLSHQNHHQRQVNNQNQGFPQPHYPVVRPMIYRDPWYNASMYGTHWEPHLQYPGHRSMPPPYINCKQQNNPQHICMTEQIAASKHKANGKNREMNPSTTYDATFNKDSTQNNKPDGKFYEERNDDIDTGKTNMIRVYNLPKSATRDGLTFLFENRRRTGGGPVQEVDFNELDLTAIIAFEDQEAVGRVLQKLPILFEKKLIEVEAFYPGDRRGNTTNNDSTERNDVENSDFTIEIHGVQHYTTDETVELYFENTKRSGGGDIKYMKREENIVFITFEEETVVQRVLAKKKHQIEGSELVVKQYLPPIPQKPGSIADDNKAKTEDCVFNFLKAIESKASILPMGKVHSEEDGIGLKFENETDEMEIREMQRHLHELETKLDRKRMVEDKKNLQQRLDTVRSELQQYNNTGGLKPSEDTLSAESLLLQCSETDTKADIQVVCETHVKKPFQDKEWVCHLCTMRNHDLTYECNACGNPRGGESTNRVTTDIHISENSGEWICSICTLKNPRQMNWCEACENPRRELTRQTVVNVPCEKLAPYFDDDTSSLSFETSLVASKYQEMPELQWDLAGLERRILGEQEIESYSEISSIREDRGLHQTNTKPVGVSKELRLVLIGSSGQGKSSTGNTILGRNEFEAIMSAESVTKRTKLGSGLKFAHRIDVVDTPGICDTGVDQKYIQNEILKCIGLTAPGPHAVLLIVNIATRFSLENKEAVNFFMDHFGDELYQYLIVVFTRKDELVRKKLSLEEYLKRIPKELDEVLSRCNYRCLAIDNDATDTDKDQQVHDLFELIDHMIEQNDNQFFTNDLFSETDKTLQKRMKKLFKSLEQKRVNEIRDIRQKQVDRVEETYQRLLQERKQTTRRNLSHSELAELRAAAKKDEENRIRTLIDDVDTRFRPMMTRSVLRRQAQQEIEDEKPGTMQKIGRGAVKVLKGIGGASLGILASPFLAVGGILFSPVVGAALTQSNDDSE